MELNEKQVSAIKCAYLDLIGSYQAMAQQDYSVHDWTAHRASIEELEEHFPTIIDEPIKLEEANHD